MYLQSRALAWHLRKVENQVAKLRYVELTQCRNVYNRQRNYVSRDKRSFLPSGFFLIYLTGTDSNVRNKKTVEIALKSMSLNYPHFKAAIVSC